MTIRAICRACQRPNGTELLGKVWQEGLGRSATHQVLPLACAYCGCPFLWFVRDEALQFSAWDRTFLGHCGIAAI